MVAGNSWRLESQMSQIGVCVGGGAAGGSQQAWLRVKEETAWMWPLLKFLFGSGSFPVWWAAFVHWLPQMCSSRQQLWKNLR